MTATKSAMKRDIARKYYFGTIEMSKLLRKNKYDERVLTGL